MMIPRVLYVADGQTGHQEVLEGLRDSAIELNVVEDRQQAMASLREGRCDLLLTGLRLDQVAVWELLASVRSLHPEIPVILLADEGSLELAVRAMRGGAADYFVQPVKIDELVLSIHRMCRRNGRRRRRNRRMAKKLPSDCIVGRSRAIRELLARVEQVATTDASVLIQGESGTGKELFATAIHNLSPRASQHMVAVNCVALAETLIESELFGHERGAFTGAHRRRRGRFELAHRGTLFLDEVGDLSIATQLKLLRALQEREIERVGGHTPISVDVRILAATNRDLEDALAEGAFREELYYRLKVITLQIPPLRERPADIPVLLDHFLRLFRDQYRKNIKTYSSAALHQLCTYHWPGNVRELRNSVESLVVTNQSGTIEASDLPRRLTSGAGATSISLPLGRSLEEVERTYIMRTLEAHGGNKARAAKALGISKKTLYRRLSGYSELHKEGVVVPLHGVNEVGS